MATYHYLKIFLNGLLSHAALRLLGAESGVLAWTRLRNRVRFTYVQGRDAVDRRAGYQICNIRKVQNQEHVH